jgi:hypothetical protein
MSIMVGTRDGLHEIAPHRRHHFAGHEVRRLAWEDQRLWAVTDGNTIWRGRDQWEAVAKADDFGVRCILPSTIGLLVGTSDGRVMRLEDSALVPLEGFDRVEGRDRWWQVDGLDHVANTRSLGQAPDGTLYANIHVGGIYRSRDLGNTWEPTIDQETDVHEIRALADGFVVAATGTAGLCVSKDHGDHWDSITDGLPSRTGPVLPYARAVASSGDVILLTASTGPQSDDAGVYRGHLHTTGPLERCRRGLPSRFRDNIDTGCLAVGGGVAVFGTTEGSVFISDDAGESWTEIAHDLPPVLCVQAT